MASSNERKESFSKKAKNVTFWGNTEQIGEYKDLLFLGRTGKGQPSTGDSPFPGSPQTVTSETKRSARGAGGALETRAWAGGDMCRLVWLLRAPHPEGVESYCPTPQSPESVLNSLEPQSAPSAGAQEETEWRSGSEGCSAESHVLPPRVGRSTNLPQHYQGLRSTRSRKITIFRVTGFYYQA